MQILFCHCIYDFAQNFIQNDILYEYSENFKRFSEKFLLSLHSKQLGKVRTSETYTATLNSFMTFRDEQDVPLDCRLYVMMLQFLQEELFIFHIVHKITENFTFLQIFIRN